MKISGYSISRASNALLNLMFVLYSALCVAPLLLVIAVSLTSENTISIAGYNFIPRQFSLDAYIFVFQRGGQVLRAYGITIFVTVFGSLLSLLITALLAYPLSRKEFKYRNAFTFYLFFHHAVQRRFCSMVYNLHTGAAPQRYHLGFNSSVSAEFLVCDSDEDFLFHYNSRLHP